MIDADQPIPEKPGRFEAKINSHVREFRQLCILKGRLLTDDAAHFAKTRRANRDTTLLCRTSGARLNH